MSASAALTRDGAYLFGPDQGVWDPNRHKGLRDGQAVLGDQFRALNIAVVDLGTERGARGRQPWKLSTGRLRAHDA